MNLFYSVVAVFVFTFPVAAQNGVGIGTSLPNGSAALDVSSTSKGILIPRMNSSQRTLISSPATGLLVFDTDTESFWFKSTTAWVQLVDSSNNGFKKTGSNVYTTGNTQVGIGTSTPLYDLHIKQTNANIGLTDASTNRVSATITADDSDVVINAFRGGATGGDIILQRSNASPALYAGNVGIGIPFTSSPAEKLHVNGNLRLQGTLPKLLLHNGTAEKGEVFINGNDLRMGTANGNGAGRVMFTSEGTAKLAMLPNGELIRPASASGANLLPLAYGRVSHTGAVLSGTGNFTVTHPSTGFYKITLTGETNVYANRDSYTILLTPHPIYWANRLIADVEIESDNTLTVRISTPRIYWENNSCSQSCGPFSYITGFKFHDELDDHFSLLIYRQ